jgi:integrase
MATAKFYLQDKKSRKKTSIRLFFNYKNTVLKYSVNLSVNPKLWNQKNYRFKHQATHSVKLNRQLQRVEDTIFDIYQNLKTKDSLITNQILKEQLDVRLDKIEKEDFFSYMKLYVEQKQELRKTTMKDYLQTYNTLKQFEISTGYLVSFESINLDFYNRFKNYILTSLKHSVNTFGKRIKVIKSIMNYATELAINKNLDYQKKAFKVLSNKIKREYLNIDEIDSMIALNLEGELDKCRDAFVLMCYLGLRYSDYKKINRNNISGTNLNIRMHKTNEDISIPIHPTAMHIIEKWDYKLPKLSNAKLNKQIKKVCRYAEIDEVIINGESTHNKYELITCHTARRSFATNGFESKVPTRVLMQITGHKKESTFLNYVQRKREVELSQILEIYPTQLRKVV